MPEFCAGGEPLVIITCGSHDFVQAMVTKPNKVSPINQLSKPAPFKEKIPANIEQLKDENATNKL
ncbi:hypothetical protein [Bacillus amyloliquefaciens]|uniref:hypothetical protein n=1 Tax=Bacillus amyloliquefaciens TaxID=1390 RepID=UPI0024A1A726|nr:hypothetical protein Bamy01_29050 [Bacillus amyloliquefaciens]